SGVSAFDVVTIASEPSAFFTSHAQPEPNWPRAASLNLVLNASKLPNALSIAAATAPDGAPPAFGAMLFQKNVWFQTCAELLKIFLSPSARDCVITSSSDRFSYFVPGANLFRLSTYVLWCLP